MLHVGVQHSWRVLEESFRVGDDHMKHGFTNMGAVERLARDTAQLSQGQWAGPTANHLTRTKKGLMMMQMTRHSGSPQAQGECLDRRRHTRVSEGPCASDASLVKAVATTVACKERFPVRTMEQIEYVPVPLASASQVIG